MPPADWDIKGRGERCAITEQPFADGEIFYTLLFRERDGFRREDLSETAWETRNDNIAPFSFWRSKFEPPPSAPPEALPKATAEELLRRLVAANQPSQAAAVYILAVMLERKRVLKPVEAKADDTGAKFLIYEHAKTGEVFVIRDPNLQLDQLADVQNEVAALLG